MPKLFYLLLISLAIVCTAAACGGNNGTGGGPVISGEISDIEITIGGVAGSPPRFQPNQIEVKKGSTAKFRISGSDGQKHTFTVGTLNIDLPLPPGETIETEPITFDETATVFFICRLHTASGATGTIKVMN